MKIAIVGAGGSFVRGFLHNLFHEPVEEEIELALVDLRPGPLESISRMVELLNEATARRVQTSQHLERGPALEGADHVLACFAVGFPRGLLATQQVLHQAGIFATDGETATPGTVVATMRQLPETLRLVADIRRLCPEAWLHLTANPLAQIIDGAIRFGGHARTVGHCHGTLYMIRKLADYTGLPPDEIDYCGAGINHFHLVTSAHHRPTGRDLLAGLAENPEWQARFEDQSNSNFESFRDLGRLFGHGYVHHYDFLPCAAQRHYPKGFGHIQSWKETLLLESPALRPNPPAVADWIPTTPEAARAFLARDIEEDIFSIMAALSGHIAPRPFLSPNLPNRGLIPGLPEQTIVEAPGTVAHHRVAHNPGPIHLPTFFLPWLHTHAAVRALAVEATVERCRQKAIEAIACDPSYRGCHLRPGELLDAMLRANEGLIEPL